MYHQGFVISEKGVGERMGGVLGGLGVTCPCVACLPPFSLLFGCVSPRFLAFHLS